MANTGSKVSVWNPNGVNSYGLELAALLQQSGYSVRLWSPGESLYRDDNQGFIGRWYLGDSKSSDGMVKHVFLRILMPICFVFTAVFRREVVVLVWARGSYEFLWFSFCAWAFKKLVFLDHNPVAGRDSGSSSDLLVTLLRRKCDVLVVHQGVAVAEEFARCTQKVVVPHLGYLQWRLRLERMQASESLVRNYPTSGRIRLLLLGALRGDKGWEGMHELFSRLDPERYELVIVGTGVVPDSARNVMREKEFVVSETVRNSSIDDLEIYGALCYSDLLLAPYILATASGTVMLALTMDLPVIGFESPGLSEVLVAGSLAPVGDYDGVVALVERWRVERFETSRASARELAAHVARSWSVALD